MFPGCPEHCNAASIPGILRAGWDTFATSNTTNVNDSSGSNSDVFVESPFKHSFPTTESRSEKSQKIQQRQSAVTITETSSVNNVSRQGIST